MRPLRLVPDNTHIRFMSGRFAGPLVSAFLSIASIILFFYPGLNYGVDFKGGVAIELRTPGPANLGTLRSAFEGLHFGDVRLQGFGTPNDVRATLGVAAATEQGQQQVRSVLAQRFPGTEIRSVESIGADVSEELYEHGLEASAAALGAVLIYVWFRFDWQYGAAMVITLLLDLTKTVGFLCLTRIEFDLNTVAAILTLIGYSVTDKVVVYDRIRENVKRHRSMPLREIIDLSINQTLGRTVATSMTVLLSILPLALIGQESIRYFAITIIFGIIVGTSSSIFIASPILLYLGQGKLGGRATDRAAAPA